MNKVYVVGLGPGGEEFMTAQARAAMERADVLCGYTVYVDLLRDKGVAVHILNMGLLDNSPMGRLVATMLLAFAEFERAQIIERTQSGRQAAMAKPGFRDGRPQKFTALQVEHALGLLSEYSYKQVEAMTGISRSTLQRAKKKVKVQQ